VEAVARKLVKTFEQRSNLSPEQNLRTRLGANVMVFVTIDGMEIDRVDGRRWSLVKQGPATASSVPSLQRQQQQNLSNISVFDYIPRHELNMFFASRAFLLQYVISSFHRLVDSI
jgi:hypothetical protein